MNLSIHIPADFNFYTTLNSHGWYDLAPFHVNETKTELNAVLSLTASKHLIVNIKVSGSMLIVSSSTKLRLSSTEKERIKNIVRSILRMQEPLDEFYSLCKKESRLRWVIQRRAGRMLRSPSVFEDVVKMMFTTNCSWAMTKIQTNHLTQKLGKEIDDNIFSFPSPERIAEQSERWLRKEISCGYRAPYLLELCRKISAKSLEIEFLRHSELPTEELYWKLRSIKGIGHYAAGNLLKLLGRYEYLGIDSWVRKRFVEIHTKGRIVSDSIIEKHYDRYGKWRGLVCLMEVTSDWHQ